MKVDCPGCGQLLESVDGVHCDGCELILLVQVDDGYWFDIIECNSCGAKHFPGELELIRVYQCFDCQEFLYEP